MKRREIGALIAKLVLTLLIGCVYYYFVLPPLNPRTGAFYGFLFFLVVVYLALSVLFGLRPQHAAPADVGGFVRRRCRVPLVLLGLILLVAIVGGILSAPVFHSGAYSRLLVPENGEFSEDVAEISFDQIPLLDSDSAGVLANRKLGELSELVSQFEVDAATAQINYQNHPVRVTYLDYGDFFKWASNHKRGIPAYLMIDMVTQEVTVKRLADGIRYSPSEYFFRNIDRHLRLHYPTAILSDTNFEVAEDGTPYWVATVIRPTIGLFGGRDAAGAILVNAVTGESTYYDVSEIPSWVDRVYNAALLLEQYNYHGKYQNGFLNAYFGQSGCTATTDGYNYIALHDDVWLYTGITSVVSDESNIGFVLVNQRTKEARFYAVSGAEEYSAMASAQGAVQQFSYRATFPLLLNVSGEPTYFMALKDASNLVKMYAMVNVSQYQVVATGGSVAACTENYRQLLAENGIAAAPDASVPDAEVLSVSGRVEEIRSAVLGGTTYYYLRLQGQPSYFRISAVSSELAVILNVGDRVALRYLSGDGEILDAMELTRANN